MPQGPIPNTPNRPVSGHDGWSSSDEFFGCLSGVPSDTISSGQLEEDSSCNAHRELSYKVMPFGLKNAWFIYQRMMTRMFEPQLGKNIEVYNDDMVVKSKVVAEHVGDLGSVFEVLRKHKLCLNAFKCSFGVGLGKFLGYMVTHCGIEVNFDKIKAINDLQPPWNPKEVQKLIGMTATLNRFISQSVDRCRPFFQLLHKWKGFEWSYMVTHHRIEVNLD